MGKLFNIETQYCEFFEETIKHPPIALIDDIDKTIQYREGFLGGVPFYSKKKHYDWTNDKSQDKRALPIRAINIYKAIGILKGR